MFYLPLFKFNPENRPFASSKSSIHLAPELEKWCIDSFGYAPIIGLGLTYGHPPYPHLRFQSENGMVVFSVYTAGTSFKLWPKSATAWWLTFE